MGWLGILSDGVHMTIKQHGATKTMYPSTMELYFADDFGFVLHYAFHAHNEYDCS